MKKAQKIYKISKIKSNMKDTENMINQLANDNWELICAYAQFNEYLIFKKEMR